MAERRRPLMRARTLPQIHSPLPNHLPNLAIQSTISPIALFFKAGACSRQMTTIPNLPEMVAFLQSQSLSGNFSQIRNNWHCSHYDLAKRILSSASLKPKNLQSNCRSPMILLTVLKDMHRNPGFRLTSGFMDCVCK